MKRKAFILILVPIFTSCLTSNIKKKYDDFETFKSEDYSYYYYDNTESNSLVVYIEGSGLSSVLGVFDGKKFASLSFAYPFSKYFNRTSSILIPEKPGMSYGGVYHADLDVVKMYTVENLVKAYAASIDHHLKSNDYEKVCVIGVSEGGLLVPKIYSMLESKAEIDELVIIGAGGLSQYDCFKIQYENYPKLPKQYRDQLKIIDAVWEDIKANPESLEDGYLGWPYNRWSSFFEYRPLNYIKKIKIPILFIQGKEDQSSPVESVKAVERLSLNNISFIYLDDMGHSPANNKQMIEVFDLILDWQSVN